jgi:hypothetical protein
VDIRAFSWNTQGLYSRSAQSVAVVETDTWTSQPKLVSLVRWLVGTVNGEQPIHRHFLACWSTMYAINFSTVESSVLVKGEDLSGDSDTSLLDFAESGELIVERIAGDRRRIYRLLGLSFRVSALLGGKRWGTPLVIDAC